VYRVLLLLLLLLLLHAAVGCADIAHVLRAGTVYVQASTPAGPTQHSQRASMLQTYRENRWFLLV
jgi:hypothetical protein